MLQRLTQELSHTDQVIERATLAYNVSLWTLEKIERSHSPQSAALRREIAIFH
jgi:hypothetical protein